MRNIIIMIIALLAISCTSDEPMRPMAPRLNSGDSIALVAIRDSLLSGVSSKYQWDYSKPEEMAGVWVKLDSATNQYRVIRLWFPSVGTTDLDNFNAYNPATEGARIPKSIGNLTELFQFSIAGEIRGPIPSELFKCPLKYLTIEGLYGPNGKQDHMEVPLDLIRLKPTIVDIRFNKCNFKKGISREIFIELAEAPHIRQIYFMNCHLEGRVYLEYCLPKCSIYFDSNNFDEVDWIIFLNGNYQVPYLRDNKIDTSNVPESVLESPIWSGLSYRLSNQRL